VSEVIEDIVSQYVEETAFVWALRTNATAAPQYRLQDLAEIDERLSAQIEGLHVSGTYGWHQCVAALESGQGPGEAFTPAILALETCDTDRLEQVLASIESAPQALRGVASAFGWVNRSALKAVVFSLIQSSSPLRRHIALTACALHRVDPGPPLAAALQNENLPLRRRALRAVGELGYTTLEPALFPHLKSADPASRLWAAWSAVLLGDRAEALALLKNAGKADWPFRTRAMQLALRVMHLNDAKNWLKELKDQPRYLAMGTGIVADAVYAPWLIKQMETPALARAAGEAFCMITGAQFERDKLEGKPPEGFEAGPTDNPKDENVAMDPDTGLQWPDPERVAEWWAVNSARFAPGERYLVGRPITPEQCQHVLREGYQRQRQAAALELALMNPATPLFETRAPAFRQQRLLATSR
jgi:uncharacterized protein (TIGR02270 family)